MISTVKFVDFWNNFDPYKDPIFSILMNVYGLQLVDLNPDLIIYSVFGNAHEYYQKSLKLFYAAENIRYNSYYINTKCNVYNDHDILNICDYAMTNYFIDHPNHIRISAGLRKFGFEHMISLNNVIPNTNKNKFCLFVVSNGNVGQTHVRNAFFDRLNEYKKVDSAGLYLNNIGYQAPYEEKKYIDFISQYKFMIAFENSEHDGYTSEKIIRCYQSKTLPIYWGNPKIGLDYNPDSLILVNKNKFETAIQEIIALDQDDDRYQSVIEINPVNPHFYEKRMKELYKFYDNLIHENKK